MNRLTVVSFLAAALTAMLGAGAVAMAAPSASRSPHVQKVTIRVLADAHGREVVQGANFAVEPGIPVTVTFVNVTSEFHTFTVPKLGVNRLIYPGTKSKPRVTRVTFTPKAFGVFRWRCEFCPRVHHEGPMGGKVYAIIGA